MNSTYVQLKKNLEYLKLNQMDLHLDEVIHLITSSPLSFTEGLCKLTNYEIDFKEANMIRSMVKVGAFPHQKGISDFDFEFQPSVNPEEIKDFATLRFLENAENIVFLGPSGVGKTHLATAIGVTATKKRYSTYFIKCHDLIMQLKKAKLENRLEAEICPDHVHMLVKIPPSLSVSSFVGYLKGKSTLMIFERHANLKYKYGNRHFWCRGYYVDTVGKNAKKIQEYIQNQLQNDLEYDQMTLKEYIDPFTGEPVNQNK